MGTRFDFDNCDTLCKYPCHFQKWEKQKNADYKDFKLKQLGAKRFKLLEVRARGITKFSSQDIQLLINYYTKKL